MSADSAHHSEETPPAPDHAAEVDHAWHHFYENARFFFGFFCIIMLTVLAFNINFGASSLVLNLFGFKIYLGSWNLVVVLFLAAIRSAFIAYFLASLFKTYSFVFRALTFTIIFLAGMIFLSMWDSELRDIGDPIKDRINPPSESHVP